MIVLILIVSIFVAEFFLKAPDKIVRSFFDIESRFTYFLALFVVYLITSVFVVDVSLSLLLVSSAYLDGCGEAIIVNPLSPVLPGLGCGSSNYLHINIKDPYFNSGNAVCQTEGGVLVNTPCQIAQLLQTALFAFGFLLSVYLSRLKEFEAVGPITKNIKL